MRKWARSAAAVAASGVIAVGALMAGSGEAHAQKATPFPHIYSNVTGAPTFDANGNPSAWNKIVWDHATVLTRGQTALMRDSGTLPVIAGMGIAPYSGMAKSANTLLATPSERARVAAGGCLALYWSDEKFTSPIDGRTIQTAAQVLGAAACTP